MRARIFIIAALSGTLLVFLFPERLRAQDGTPDEPRAVTLLAALEAIGTRQGVYFTIESAWSDGESSSVVESQMVPLPVAGPTVEAELRTLSNAAPRLTVVASGSNPAIIHVVDSRLHRGRDYAIDINIPKLDFSGTTSELIAEIARLGIPVQNPAMLFTHELLVVDQLTRVRVAATGMQVRDVLSDFVPLAGRGRVLWVARTREGTGQRTVVMYRGAAPLPADPAKAGC